MVGRGGATETARQKLFIAWLRSRFTTDRILRLPRELLPLCSLGSVETDSYESAASGEILAILDKIASDEARRFCSFEHVDVANVVLCPILCW